MLFLFLFHLCKAFAAINRSVRLRLKGNLCFLAAGCTYGGEVLAGTAVSVLSGITAGLAALGLVLEAALCIELLLTGGENEFLAAFLAYQCLVFEHF